MAQFFGKDYAGTPPQNYERFFVPAIGAPLAADLLEVAALCPGERVVDVACGTGVVARLSAEVVGDSGSVVGVDANPGMLAVARSAVISKRPIEWHEASAESMPLPDATFDAVLCQMGLQFMADKRAALREMGRVLVPGGRLVLNVPGPTPKLFRVLAEALTRHVNPDAAMFVEKVFSLHNEAEIKALISDADFNDVSVRSDIKQLRLPAPDEFLWQYLLSTPLAAGVVQLDDQRRRTLEKEVVNRWADFVTDNRLALEVRVAIATAVR